MSHYIRRVAPDGIRIGWTGPIRSPRQADKEAAAWQSIGWAAAVEPSTPAIRAEVRAWSKRTADAR